MIARGTCRLCGKTVRALDAKKHERTCLRAIRAAGREVCIPCATVFATPVLATRHALAMHRAADVSYVRGVPPPGVGEPGHVGDPPKWMDWIIRKLGRKS